MIKKVFIIILFCNSWAYSSLKAQQDIPDRKVHQDTLTARKLIDEKDRFLKNGDYNKALFTLDKVFNLYSNNNMWEAAVSCAVEQAKISDNFDTAEFKEKYAKLAFDLARTHLHSDNITYASASRQKAELLMMQGALDSANHYLALAVPVFKKAQKWVDLCWVEILQGVNYLNQTNLDASQKHLDQVKNILSSHPLDKDNHITIEATLLNLYGVLYELQGDYDNAIRNTRKALENDLKDSELNALDSSYISLHYNNLGAFFMIKGDHPRALDNFIQASQFNNGPNQGALMINIGELLTRTKQIPEAIAYFRKALKANSNERNKLQNTFQAYKGISSCYSELSQYDSAYYYYQKAESVPINFRKYEAYLIIGNVFLKQGETQKAIEFFNTSIKNYNTSSNDDGGNTFFLSLVYRFLGDAYMEGQDINNALKSYQKALTINHAFFKDSLDYTLNPPLEGVHQPGYFVEALWRKAKALSKLKTKEDHLQASLKTYELTIQWVDTMQNNYATDRAQLDWSSAFKRIYEEAIEVAFHNFQLTKDKKYLELAFDFSEKSKNRLLLESLKSTEGKFLANVPDSIIQREKDLNLDIVFYEKALRQAEEQKAEGKVKLYQQYLSQSRLSLAALQEQLEANFPRYQDWKYGGTPIKVKDIQQTLLDPQSAMLEYFTGDSSIYVFVISKNTFELIPLGSPEKIISSINEFRKILLDLDLFERDAKQAVRLYNEKATKLYQMILQQPLASIEEDIKHLIIVPDGQINSIPFEALTERLVNNQQINFATIPYLLYHFSMHYVYSANLLAKNKIRQGQVPANTQCLALAPPHGSSSPNKAETAIQENGEDFLTGTSLEIMEIANFYEGLFDPDITATESKFKSLAGQYGILHLATHGFADFENANFNYLKFFDPSEEQTSDTEDNLLYHYEISNMDLAAQLVVLSACETGVGKYENGEGVFSLARSFMYAGTPSVVMSLWKVSDQGTSQLMPYFYESLSSGKSKDQAMQDAKLRFLEEANLEYRHPFYWSAFVVLGDAQQLKSKPSKLFWWGLAGIVLLGFIFFLRKK